MTKLKQLRKAKGLTQKEMCHALGLAQSTLSAWETGRYEPDMASLRMLAGFFGCSVDDIVGSREYASVLPGQLFAGIADSQADGSLAYLSQTDSSLLRAYHSAPENIRNIIDTALAPYMEEDASAVG